MTADSNSTVADPFARFAREALGEPLRASALETFQVNVGLVCNLACNHCHVESSPARRERMDWDTMRSVLDHAQSAGARVIDVTGGAPEMHPHIREFVGAARERGFDVIVRTNLSILLRAGFDDLPEFFAARRVRLVASLPCYLEENVDRQRGDGVYADSIAALRRLNALGYGVWPDLVLDLVFNPIGAVLPPDQETLEAQYRSHLEATWGVRFTRLLTLANMPIGRFLDDLRARGEDARYVELLRARSRAENVGRVMCRTQIHVAHDGSLHDCDFNHALRTGLAQDAEGALPDRLDDFDANALRGRRIRTGTHCFGCTAGNGSSCGGALR